MKMINKQKIYGRFQLFQNEKYKKISNKIECQNENNEKSIGK